MKRLHIGLDLDNTIIDYSDVFADAGKAIGLLAENHGFSTKDEVKRHLRDGPGGDQAWMRLQGQVYGRFIGKARAFPGLRDFLAMARRAEARVSIVSHKTQYGHFDEARVPLWDAATGWLESEGLLAPGAGGIHPFDVNYRETRGEKIAAIAAIGCEIFVDDLPELLNDPRFPAGIEKIWFAPDADAADGAGLTPHRSWKEIAKKVSEML